MTRTGRLSRWFLCCGALWAGTVPAWSQVRIPGSEDGFLGTIEVVNRWRTLNGHEDLYRSTVDLGEGPKLNAFRLQYREVSGCTELSL